MKAMLALAALLVAVPVAAVHAPALPVTIDGLNDAAKTCGITESLLESPSVRTLEGSELQPDASAGGWLRVRVTVNQTRRSPCAAHISVQMKASEASLPLGETTNTASHSMAPNVVLCDEGGDYSAAKASFPLEVESAVEHSIEQCLGSLKN